MKGVLTVVESILAVGFVTQIGLQEYLRKEIKQLLDNHKEQVDLMLALNQYVGKIVGLKNLVSQLRASVLFAADNWRTIFDDIEEKNDLIKKIIQKFPDVKTHQYDYTWRNFVTQVLADAFLGYIGWQYLTGNAQAQIYETATSFKTFCQNAIAKIRGIAPQVSTSRVNETGQTQIIDHGTNPTEIPTESRDSTVQAIEQGRESRCTEITRGAVRILFLFGMIYGFYQGLVAIDALGKQLDQYKKYFSEKGGFEQAETGIISLMNLVASDIFNLGNCSRSALHDAKNMFYIKSITLPSVHFIAIQNAKKLDPLKFGLNQKFIDDSRVLLNFSKATKNSEKSNKEKLQDLKNSFQKFYDQNKPEIVFMKIAQEFSQVMSTYSIISSKVNEDQIDAQFFLKKVASIIDDQRGSKFDQKTPEEKKQKDTNCLKEIFQKYKNKFQLDDVEIEKASSSTKDVMFQTIISFVDNFYYDDPSGKTLFGKNISEHKSNDTYSQILKKQMNKTNLIPVSMNTEEEENKEVQTWMNMAKSQNEKQGYKCWPKDESPKPQYRYIRLFISNYTDQNGKVYSTLLSVEGLLVKYKGTFYKLQRQELNDSITLNKYEQPKPAQPKPV